MLKNFKSEVIEPITATIPTASLISGLGRTTLYQRIKEGKIEAVKSGDRTLVIVDSLRAHLRQLPAYRPEIQTQKVQAAVAGRQAKRRGK